MGTPPNHDITGWCERGTHDSCRGVLVAATGWHWFCACTCHPTPTSLDVAPTVTVREYRKAFDTWATARAALVDADTG